jgi:plastocyanin
MSQRNRRALRLAAVTAIALAALPACGTDKAGDAGTASTTDSGSSSAASSSSGAPSSSASTQAQSITATEADFSISLGQDSLRAGSYTIKVVNDGSSTHDLVVEQAGNDVAGTDGSIAPGQSTTFTVDLQPGEYVFYCSIGNHRAMGMELTVQVT